MTVHPQGGSLAEVSGCTASSGDSLTADMLSAMELTAAMGETRALRRMFKDWNGVLLKETDGATLSKLTRLRAVLTHQQEIERQHGRGAALDLNHATVQEWISLGLLDSSRVSSARAFLDVL